MGGLGAYAANEVLDHVFKTGAYTAETNLYVALCTSTLDKDDSGSSLAGELSGGGYVRVTCNTWDAAGTSEATENSQPITFAQATADLGTVTDFAIMNHSTTGSLVAFGKLTAGRVISNGDTYSFATGDLDVTLA